LGTCLLLGLALAAGFGYSFQLVRFFDQFLYQDQILYTKQSAYQHLVMTRWNQDLRLFIDGNIQFSSLDEYRYHEPLVHLPMLLALRQERILVLGGGDGLATREVLRYPSVDSITLVDLDPAMTHLGQTHPVLVQLNDSALHDPRVQIVNQDAFTFVETTNARYDVIIIDLPDPNNTALGKLYSQSFYQIIKRCLAAGGVIITQSTSPYFAPDAFWCIHHTLASVFASTIPITVYVPSFGQWGFNLAIQPPARLPAPPDSSLVLRATDRIRAQLAAQPWADSLRYLNAEVVPGLFTFDGDMAERPTPINQLDNQLLLEIYEHSWDQWR
jgi:spermidine synthase